MDWRERFRAPVVRHAETARGRRERGVVLSDRDGPIEAYAWDVDSGALRRLTAQGTATLVAAITPDGAHVLHLLDTTGGEHGHVAAVPFEGGEPVDLTPRLPPYAVLGLSATADGFVAGAVVDGVPHVLDVVGDDARLLPFDGAPLGVDVVGDLLAVTTFSPGGGTTTDVVLLDRECHEEVDRLDGAQRWSADEHGLGLGVVRDGWLRPALWRPGDGVVHLDVDLPGDVVVAGTHGDTVLLRWSHRSVDGLAVLDGDLRRLAVPLGVLPPGPVARFDGDRALVVWSGAEVPGTVIEVDGDGHRTTLEDATAVPGAAWQEFTVADADGPEVQGWLLVPPGEGPHPTVLHGHGGPTSVQGPGFSPIAQAWVDRGFAFATVNYRGSTGFGEVFREALTGRIGGPELDDLVAARRTLVDTGVADPDRVVLNGYSYGGYLTCMLLGTQPSLWAAGVAGAPVVDWPGLYEDSPATRHYAEALFGGGPDTRHERMVEASPTTYVDAVRAPLLVSAPADDARTPIGPVRRYVDALRERGVPVELHELTGGHAGVGHEQAIAMVASWLAFAEEAVEST